MGKATDGEDSASSGNRAKIVNFDYMEPTKNIHQQKQYYMDGMHIAKIKAQYNQDMPLMVKQHYQKLLIQTPKKNI